jgi:superfamily I DNA and/or RNA helicase
MEGKNLNDYPAARRGAIERIQQARLVFTTCAGAGLGLLPKETFSTVIIDEVSQQTEPTALIPLVKGCDKAILVGDHVQLHATVGPHSKIVGFDISLFERLYGTETPVGGLSKVMLCIQYRMHPDICRFPLMEFYMGLLQPDDGCRDTPLPRSLFPWPQLSPGNGPSRCVSVPCTTSEDLGHRSKGNRGQADVCRKVYQLLTTLSSSDLVSHTPPPSIAVLTPYSRQVEQLQDVLPSTVPVATIDGF